MGRDPRGGRPLRTTLVFIASASVLVAGVASAQAVTPRPNLVVTSTSTAAGRVTIGAGFAVTDTTKNAGAARANPSTTRYYLSKDALKNPTDQPLVGSRAVPALAPGRSSRGTVTVKVPITTRIGGYFVLACADDRHQLTESSERDNCRATTSMISVVKGRPDLVVTAVGDPPATIESGASFDSTDTTKNAGTGDAKASTTAFYLSADALKSADDSQVGQRAVGPLAGRTASSGSTPLTAAGVPDGSYFLLACADALKAVVESKEANNCRAATGKVQIAPPPPGAIDPGSSTSMYDASAFLWTGNDPVQEGVDPGTIDLGRVVVVHGLVVNAHTGDPLDGVTVTVLDHPEFGVTHTHDGGRYDMALNGGTEVTLELEQTGFLSAQKTVDTPWQDYVQVEPVAMVHLDPNATLVDLGSAADFQVVRGSTETDEDGTRRATLLVPKGTTATMTLPGGGTQPLTTMHVRATEYTVGGPGFPSMPGTLPTGSGYTYAVEFTVDEAQSAGATSVHFSKPLVNYTENFTGAPVGTVVPTGSYDRETGQWVADTNGLVIKIVSESGGVANVDADGDGNADTDPALAALGITTAERQQMATLYDPPKELWRVPVNHFSPWDHNWPYGPPMGAKAPNLKWFNNEEPDPCFTKGSSIACETQTLGETIPITGTPFDLAYRSDRVPGAKYQQVLDIPVTGPTLPNGIRGVRLHIEVAGRVFEERWEDPSLQNPTPLYPAPTPNLVYHFVWDGKDAYGRDLQGRPVVTVQLAYAYDAQYYAGQDEFQKSFAQFGDTTKVWQSRAGCRTLSMSVRGGRGGAPTRRDVGRARRRADPNAVDPFDQFFCGVWVQQTAYRSLGNWDAVGADGLGGWTLSVHHAYDPIEHVLHMGDGVDARSDAFSQTIHQVRRFGGGEYPFAADLAPDGTIYYEDAFIPAIYKLAPDGTQTHVAGVEPGPGGCPMSGLGGPATAAALGCVDSIAIAPDGSLYIYTQSGSTPMVLRIDPQGIITRFAGSTTATALGDDGPALDARLGAGLDIDVAPNGNVCIADSGNRGPDFKARVRCIDSNGIIRTVAGGGTDVSNDEDLGDGEPALQANLTAPYRLDFAPDGTLYIPDKSEHIVDRVGIDGIIHRVAGNHSPGPYSSDGTVATSADIADPVGVAVDKDGNVFIRTRYFGVDRIIKVDGSGVILPLVGRSDVSNCPFPEDGSPAGAVCLDTHNDLIEAYPDGQILCSDGRVAFHKVGPAAPGFSAGNLLLPSPDGAEVYEFTGSGKHLRTFDALTGALRYVFSYDDERRLSTVTDAFGNVTHIERDALGVPTAIVAPGGQITPLTLDGNGYLASVADPAGDVTHLVYGTGGLLTSLTDPNGGLHQYQYDANGRLVGDENPAGRVKTLSRVEAGSAATVTVTTSLGRQTTYETKVLDSGARQRTVTSPSGAQTRLVVGDDGTMTVTQPDGTTLTYTMGPDPRWGMRSPMPTSEVVKTPGGATRTIEFTRSVTPSDPSDPFDWQVLTDDMVVNPDTPQEQRWETSYDRSTRTMSRFSQEFRFSEIEFNANGQPVQFQGDAGFGSIDPVTFTYDAHGRLSKTTQGPRSTTYAYDAANRIVSSTDALGAQTTFAYDAADRPVTMTTPAGDAYHFGYDANGNVTSVTMPSGSQYGVPWTADDIEAGLDPPGPGAMTKTFDLDGALTERDLIGGRVVGSTSDGSGRPTGFTFPEATVAFGYDAADQLVSLTRTPGGGSAQHLDLTHDGSLLTDAAWTGPSSGHYHYTYDDALAISGLNLVSGADTVDTAVARDGDGLLTSLGAYDFTRTGPAGATTGIGDGTLDLSFDYDELGQESARTFTVGGQQRYAGTLTRDAAGRITKKIETTGGSTHTFDYTYDADGRLTQVKRDGSVVETYAYDVNGNRTSRTVGGGPAQPATYDTQDRITGQGGTTYTFNADGQLTGRGSDTFSYDALGELVSATVSGHTVTYAYDGLRRRVARTDDSGTTQFLYGNPGNPFQVTALRSASGQLSTFSYDEAGRLFAIQRGANRFYVGTDQVGTPRVVTDTSGAVVKAVAYDAYGGLTSDSAPGFDLPIGFAGGVADPATGLVHFGLRDYDPVAGRWTTRDPARFGGNQLNMYAYVNDDPVSAADLSGMVGVEASLYAGIGFEASINISSKGVSACFGVGVGVGEGLGVTTGGPVERSGLYTSGELTGKFGPLGATTGFEIDPCGETSQSPGSLTLGPVAVNENLDVNVNTDPAEWGKEAAESTKLKLEGKLSGKYCATTLD